MEALIIEETELTPRVEMDPILGKFQMSKSSLPENAITFYGPISDWIIDYAKQPNSKTVFAFKMNYFNTASSKQIFRILKHLANSADRTNLSILWYYSEKDQDMRRSGERFQALLGLEFTFKSC